MTQAPVATVTIAPGTLRLLLGASGQLTATTRDANGIALPGRSVTWASTDVNVAAVSTLGVVTTAGDGTVTITATSEGKIGSAQVTVTSVSTVAFASVVTGGAHTCALTAALAAYCWGRGESGQLGVASPGTTCSFDTSSSPCSLVPVAVGGGLFFARLTAGGAHTCGLTNIGTVFCWGSNASGQLGNNSTIASPLPVIVATSVRFASIDAGLDHTCGVAHDGSVYCWGRNDRGQLGDGTSSARLLPAKVVGELSFQLVTAGGYTRGHTCGVTVAGDAYCWGDNENGQLGIGNADLSAHPLPAQVSSGLKFLSLSAGLGSHTCGRAAAGSTHCWGANTFGALGNGSTTDSPVPVQVSGGAAFAQVVAGGYIGHTCALTSGGAALCWGENSAGATGDGTTGDPLTPSPVAGGRVWATIDAGFRHTCGQDSSGALHCWGSGRAGQLGNNGTGQSNLPLKVVGQP
ncbi:MAG: Ig-like domain-containing protein [Gemmatimonadota bacterium]|nr:Ig-like domain-containing protein [Gemmatimonadota bacterium]